MKQLAFAIKDNKVGEFHSPFCVRHEKEARRLLEGLVVDNQSTIHNYPEDFSLYWVGEFDTTSGEYENGKGARFVCNAVEYKKPEEINQTNILDLIDQRIQEAKNAENI